MVFIWKNNWEGGGSVLVSLEESMKNVTEIHVIKLI